MTNEEDLRETTGGGFDRGDKKKPKGKFFKSVGSVVKKGASATGKGAKYIGTTIAKGSGSLAKKGYESIKEYNSPEAQQARLDKQERKLEVEEKIAGRRARIRKLQPSGGNGGASMLGGFQGIDMGNVLGGGGGGSNGGMDVGGNLGAAFGAIGGTPQRAVAIRQPRRYRTVRVKRIKYKSYRPRGKRKSRRRRVVSYSKKRVAVRTRSHRQPRAFDPFSQF